MSVASSSLLYYNKLKQSIHIGGKELLGTWFTNSMHSLYIQKPENNSKRKNSLPNQKKEPKNQPLLLLPLSGL